MYQIIGILPMRGLLNDVNTRRHNKHVLFMLSIAILVNWMQIACLISAEEDGCKLSDDYFTMCVVLTLTNLIGHVPLTCHVKFATNRIDSFVVTTKQKENIPRFTPNAIEV